MSEISNFEVISAVPGLLASSETAIYSCRLDNLWTAARHPQDYPSANAHWTSPVLAAHNSNYQMWGPGVLATEGVELVAESGITSTLLDEISTSGDTGDNIEGSDQFNSQTTNQILPDIEMTSDFPLLSSITMVAPSPDWFSGIYDFSAIDGDVWLSEFSIQSYPWDSGTETGDTYTLGNPPQDPVDPIFQLTAEVPPASTTGVFLDPTGNTVLPVAEWTCNLQNDATESSEPSSAPVASNVGTPTPTAESAESSEPSSAPVASNVGTPTPTAESVECTELFFACESDDDCCDGGICIVRLLNQPKICVSAFVRSRAKQSVGDGMRGGQAGRIKTGAP